MLLLRIASEDKVRLRLRWAGWMLEEVAVGSGSCIRLSANANVEIRNNISKSTIQSIF